MDKNAIKKYAVWARTELIERVTQRAEKYDVSKGADANADSVHGHLLIADEKKQRQALLQKVNEKGFGQVMEEVAYTWFNRFSALRFMEVNGYLPTHVRVFTDEENRFKPQILAEAINLEIEGLDMEKVYALKDANDNDALFKYLIITQCNALSSILLGMFQKIDDYTELLFPDNLLREGSAIEQMIAMIPEDNWDVSVGGQIEIIGWLYQYYNDEKKDQVINIYKGTVKKEDIPAATQLFTTDWVVRYIIDNSVGRYWIERNPSSQLANELEFFVMPKNGELPVVNETITPEQLTVFDPCMGSAHFGVYAFEVLMKIYQEYGFTDREAAASIVQNNLYGLDIDDRAAQLAYFAIMMKARQYDRRFFSRGLQPHFYAIEESNHVDSFALDYFINGDDKRKKDITSVIQDLKDAKEYGSIIHVHPVDFDALLERFEEMEYEVHIAKELAVQQLLPLVKVAKLLYGKYTVVVTNPPYLNKYNDKLKEYIVNSYKDYSGDLFSVFMYRNFDFCAANGFSGFMTPYVWMSIKSYIKLRNYIVEHKSIVTLIQMEYSAFEEATVPICSFVLRNSKSTQEGIYFDLSEFTGGMKVQKEKVLDALSVQDCPYVYSASQDKFAKIPSSPITAYWVSDSLIELYKYPLIGQKFSAKEGVGTRNDDVFLKLHWEVERDKVAQNKRWILTDKAGGYRKWYLGMSYVMDWENDGARIRNYRNEDGTLRSRPQNTQYLFKPGVSWGKIGSGASSFRYRAKGYGFNDAAPTLFGENEYPLLAALNTNIYKLLLKIRGGTLNMTCGVIEELPQLGYCGGIQQEAIEKLVTDNISLSHIDWDDFETSWDFQSHPLISVIAKNRVLFDDISNIDLAECFMVWEKECEERFNQLKANEEELNRIFIDIYGLQDELTPEVEDKDVTVRKADLQREVKSLISYAVGCMFGRYSLDEAGLAYAGGDWDESKYKVYPADKDHIIPICDDEYFPDDIVGRFKEFLKTVYGEDSLKSNLKFIADALGSKGQPEEVIRNYFMNDFYTDHLKIYQKRPIYWLFDSGKKGGFKALIYMHRYQPDTIARIRTDYVHEQQGRYRTAIADLEQRIESASTSERVKLTKQLKKLQDQSAEIHEYEEKIHHLADQYISIDLDDGVKKNYAKFQNVLAKIK